MSQITIIAIVLTGLICFPAAGDESGYYTIDIMGKRIGYADYFVHESESRVYVASQTFMKVKMLGQPYDVTYQAIGTYSSQIAGRESRGLPKAKGDFPTQKR